MSRDDKTNCRNEKFSVCDVWDVTELRFIINYN